jgi:hypothetical protein
MTTAEPDREVVHAERVVLPLAPRQKRTLLRCYGVTISAALLLGASLTVQDHSDALKVPSWLLTVLMVSGFVFAGAMFYGAFLTLKAHMTPEDLTTREVVIDRRDQAILLVDNGVLYRQLRLTHIANFSLRFERDSRTTESDNVDTASFTVMADMKNGPPVKLGEFSERASERVGTTITSTSIAALEQRAKALISRLKKARETTESTRSSVV